MTCVSMNSGILFVEALSFCILSPLVSVLTERFILKIDCILLCDDDMAHVVSNF